MPIDGWKQLILAPVDTRQVAELVRGACHATSYDLRISILTPIDRVCVVVVLEVCTVTLVIKLQPRLRC